MSRHNQVIIVGAGVVGLTQALALAQIGMDVVVCDRSLPTMAPLEEGSYDPRVFAINDRSMSLFQSLGIWSSITQQRLGAYRHMKVWSEASEIAFDAKEVGRATLGHIIESRVLVNALLERIQLHPQVEFLKTTSLNTIRTNSNEALLIDDELGELSGAMIIGADGGNSWVRSQSGFDVDEHPNSHHALVTTVTLAKGHAKTAYEWFYENKALAFLPLSDKNMASIVWSVPPALADVYLKMKEPAFLKALQGAVEMDFGDMTLAGPRFKFPIVNRHTKQYVGERLALVGDAAHTIHPMAGLGLNLGLMDVQDLTAQVSNGLKKGRAFYRHQALRPYERRRKLENRKYIHGVGFLQQYFQSHTPPISWARDFSLSVVNHVPVIKRHFIQQAMGERGRPSIA